MLFRSGKAVGFRFEQLVDPAGDECALSIRLNKKGSWSRQIGMDEGGHHQRVVDIHRRNTTLRCVRLSSGLWWVGDPEEAAPSPDAQQSASPDERGSGHRTTPLIRSVRVFAWR